jgi:hypothetical protein
VQDENRVEKRFLSRLGHVPRLRNSRAGADMLGTAGTIDGRDGQACAALEIAWFSLQDAIRLDLAHPKYPMLFTSMEI